MDNNDDKYKIILKKAANKIEELTKKINEKNDNDEIAVIGYSCHFPGGANTPEKFWKLLSNGVDPVTEIKESRFDYNKYYSEDVEKKGKMNTKNASFLNEDIKEFDNVHFEISGIEAKSIDPQHRLLLEVSWEAMENSALNIEKLKGSRTGVFIAISSFEYGKKELFSGDVNDITPYSTTGILNTSASGRLSYFYDFKGPAITCDTACSSSIVALNIAIDSLQNSQCDMAIVGGVNLLIEPEGFIGLSKFGGLSKDGRSKAFDNSADGFGRGEGCGVVILKRLKDAKEDGNEVLALVKGVSIGQDGKSNGFTAPNGISQQNLIKQTLKNANLNVDDIDYIETHGTGTSLGDHIEAQSISEVFKNKKNKILIGAVKSNIGHLEAAAGMASIIKVLLSIEKKQIPPNLHFNNPNHNINWNKIEVVDELIDWKKDNGVRRAGISSFGFSGTLAHAIIEEVPEECKNEELDILPYHIMTLSAKNERSLKYYIGSMKEYILQEEKSIGDIAYTTNISRSFLKYKYVITGKSKEEFIKKIEESLDETNTENLIYKKSKVNNKIAFLFTGQGSIYKDIAKDFYNTSKVFRETLNLCNEKFKDILDISLIDGIYGDDDKLLDNPIYSQPAIFSIEYALTKVWDALGIRPNVVIGHSIGEYVAACYSGLISLDDVIKMIAERGKIMQYVDINGKMVGVLTNVENVRNAIIESGCKNVSIAAINAPQNVTISGLSNEVDTVVKVLQSKEKIFINKLNIDHPYHSEMMKNYTDKYNESIGDIKFSKLKMNMISSISGNLEKEESLGQRKYWVDHLCNTVNYQAAIESAKKLGIDIFIEIGGDATLSGLANQCIEEELKCLPSLRKGVKNYTQLFNSIAVLFLSGVELKWNSFYKTYKKAKVKLPNYNFQRKRFWIDSKNEDIKVNKYEESVIMPNKFQVNADNDTKSNIKLLKAKDKIEVEIKEMIKSLTWLEIDEIQEDINLFTLGLDSLILVAFNKKISSKYNVEISLNKFFVELDTIEKITEYIYENINEDIIDDSVEYNNDNLLYLEEDGINSANTEETRKMKVSCSFGDISGIEQIFNNQMKVMTEQLEILRNVTDTNSKEKINNNNLLMPIKEKIVKKDIKVNKESGDFYVPYKKLDLAEKEKLDDLKLKYIKKIEEKYTSYTKSSKENTQKYRKVYANNRNIAGFRPELKEMVYQIVAKNGKGSKLYDMDDNEFIDLTMGFGVNLFGHNPSFVKDALNEEILNGMPVGPMGRLAGQVAEQISKLTGVERVAFYNSGTEANMVAARIARAITGRKKIITFTGSYHGTFDGFLGIPSESKDGKRISVPLAPGIMDNMLKDLVVLNYNSQDSLEYIKNNSDDIAGVLVETVQSRRPDVQPKEFLKKLRKVTEDGDIALIFDEIITGFRILSGGSQEFFGIKADIVTYGKIAGGGMPIGIVTGKSKYLDSIDGGMWSYGDDSVPPCDEKRSFVAGTFCHHPLAMAASNAMLKYIKQNKDTIYKTLNEKTDKFVNEINLYCEEEHVPISVVNFGSLFRFILKGDFEIFFYGLIEKGIYIWEGRNCFFSTEHSNVDIEKITSAIKLTIQEMKKAGYFGAMKAENIAKPEVAVALVEEQNFEMSLMQKGIYTQSVRSEVDPYNIISIYRIKGKLDIDKIESIIEEIVQRHESLRTRLYLEDEELKQEVLDDIKFSINKIKKDEGDDLDNLISKSITNFNLSKPPLFKVTLINIGDNDNILIFNFHHAISDGISMNIFTQEFIELYSNEPLPPLNKQYRDFVNWEKKYLNSDERKNNEKYWLNKLEGDIERLNLPKDYKVKSEVSFIGNTVKMNIDKNTVSNLKLMAKDNECSLYMILVTAFNVLLKKLSGNDDILIRTPVTNRGAGLFEESIGMFTNTIVLRNNPSDEKDFKVFLGEVKQNCLEAYSNMYYPFNLLVNKGENQLNNIMFIYENANQRVVKIDDLEISPYEYKFNASDFDFSIEILEEKGSFNINLTYKTDLYKEDTIKRWGKYYENILKFILNTKNENIKINDIELLKEDEKHKLLVEFNDTEGEYPKNNTIYELFEEQVEKTPNNIAVVCENKELTYKELNERANVVANILRENGVEADKIVGIMVERSVDMIISIMGILKAGGAYLPIDPKTPKERISYMLNDSSTEILLTQKDLNENFKYNGKIINIDEVEYLKGTENLCGISSAYNLAYVIYTSGTTGNPKGVMIEHKQVNNFISGIIERTNINKAKTILCVTTISFDIFGLETLLPLTNGMKVVIAKEDETVDASAIEKLILENRVEVIQTTPSRMKLLMEGSKLNKSLEQLKLVLVGGEQMPSNLAEELIKFGNLEVYNMYGPTETTIWSTIKKVESTDLTIGKPILNTKIYILDKNLNIQPVGMVGDLFISGDGVGRGYINNEELTNEKFINNPFEYGKKLYKTGDLAKWRSDGEIDFLGRSDYQVKIRGYRIELSEIESKLLELSGIKEVVVIDKFKDDIKYLCVYYVSDKEYTVGEIREELRKTLPKYMLPSYFVKVESLPLSVNGKIDRKSLPEPEGQINIGTEYEAPRNELEEKLVELWQGVLGVSDIGTNDNFFDIGGDSLKATILVGRIYKELNVEVPLKIIFNVENIKGLSEYIKISDKKAYELIEKAEEKEYYEASIAQKGMYIIQEVNNDSIAYNMPVMLDITGNLEISKLNQVFLKLIKRHEAIRTSFHYIGNKILQKIHNYEKINFQVEEIKVSNEKEVELKIKDFIKPFNLQNAPLLRVGLIRLEKERHIILFDMHHIISDGTSMAILTKEFSELYEEKDLKELNIQYKDYSEWQLNKKESEEFKKQEEYWLKEFDGEIPELNIPKDYERPEVKDFRGESIRISLDKELTNNLRKIAKATGCTMYMVLLANFNILLSKYSGQQDIIVGTSIAGRRHIGLENIIGMFVNTLPIRSTVNKDLIFKDYLKLLKEKVLKVYENQGYELDELIESIGVNKKKNRNPLFDIIFILQNTDRIDMKMDKLNIKQTLLGDNIAKYDIAIEVEEREENIDINVSYATSLYGKRTIENLMEYYKHIIRTTSSNSTILVENIELITEIEEEKFLENANCCYEEEVIEFEF